MNNHPNLISATIVKDSIARGHRITTFKLVFPRYILAELNTHRVFNKNSASSRAIPFRKMVKSALDNPFIPIAFQKEHPGMQGTEYLDHNAEVGLPEFLSVLSNVFKYKNEEKIDKAIFRLLEEVYETNRNVKKTLVGWWLYCRDKAVKTAILMSALGVTKQLCNRILEPFIYHTVLLTATEYYNFFKLRCPSYQSYTGEIYKSKRDYINDNQYNAEYIMLPDEDNTLEWLKSNKGAGEIHIMDLAEKMYDARNKSTPEVLKPGQWHIPYGDNISNIKFTETFGIPLNSEESIKLLLQISTARMARISYETLGDNPKIDYEADTKLHDDLLAMEHWSPFEHSARVPTDEEYYTSLRSMPNGIENGWFYALKGFIPYRYILNQK